MGESLSAIPLHVKNTFLKDAKPSSVLISNTDSIGLGSLNVEIARFLNNMQEPGTKWVS